MKLILLLFAILSSLQLSAQKSPHDLPYLKVYNDLTDTHHMMGEQALWHYRNHQYAEADNYFRAYLEEADVQEWTISDMEIMYAYAYNRFFQGDESQGMKILKYCAYQRFTPALEDYKILKDCRTIGINDKEIATKKAEFEEIRRRYDYLRAIGTKSPATYWEQVSEKDRNLREIRSLIHERKVPKTLKRANASINKAEAPMIEYLRKCNPYVAGVLEKDLMMELFESTDKIQELRVYPANEKNAFATPYGQIYLTDALVNLYHRNETLLLGICAHEATHYCCQHSLVAQWNQEKKVQKNTVLAGIAIGLGTILDVGIGSDFNSLSNSIIDICTLDAFYFQYRYGREQEIEADIAAYKFCESTGIGGYAYIMALQLLGNGTGYMKAAKTSDHPTNNYRVSLLKYIYQKEHPQHRHAPLPGQMLVSCQ